MPAQQRLTLDLAGPKITAAQFGQAINAFFDLLDEVSEKLTGTALAVEWVITVEAGSNRIHAAPEIKRERSRTRPDKVVRTISRGVDLVGRRAQRPSHFSDAALRITRDLSTVADGTNVVAARIRAPGQVIDLSPKTAEHVDRLLGVTIQDYGTVEGRLQTLSERRGPHFAIYDDLTDQAIRCNVSREQLDEAWKVFGRRVAVSGLIRYRKTGEPLSIEAEQIVPFPSDDTLPDADDVLGLLSTN